MGPSGRFGSSTAPFWAACQGFPSHGARNQLCPVQTLSWDLPEDALPRVLRTSDITHSWCLWDGSRPCTGQCTAPAVADPDVLPQNSEIRGLPAELCLAKASRQGLRHCFALGAQGPSSFPSFIPKEPKKLSGTAQLYSQASEGHVYSLGDISAD